MKNSKKNENLVRKCRISKKWTQLKLALEADVSPATISKAENGQLISDLSKQKIADALGETTNVLFP